MRAIYVVGSEGIAAARNRNGAPKTCTSQVFGHEVTSAADEQNPKRQLWIHRGYIGTEDTIALTAIVFATCYSA